MEMTMAGKRRLLKFNKLVREVEELRMSMEKDGVLICSGYERGYPPKVAVQIVKPSMNVIAPILKRPITIKMEREGTTRTLNFEGVEYFEWERTNKEGVKI